MANFRGVSCTGWSVTAARRSGCSRSRAATRSAARACCCGAPRARARARLRRGGIELLEVRLKLETGRTHQLMRAARLRGLPDCGRRSYGSPSLEALAADAAAGAPAKMATILWCYRQCRSRFTRAVSASGARGLFCVARVRARAELAREDEEATTLLSLPEELVRQILCCASRGTVCSAGRACKLAALAADDAVWRALYERRWSHELIEPEGVIDRVARRASVRCRPRTIDIDGYAQDAPRALPQQTHVGFRDFTCASWTVYTISPAPPPTSTTATSHPLRRRSV